MDEDVKQLLKLILHERMKVKAKLEMFRFMDETDRRKSYMREIDQCLDRMNELNEMYEKIINQL